MQFGVVALNNTQCTEITLFADPPQAGLWGKAESSSPPKTSILRQGDHLMKISSAYILQRLGKENNSKKH